MRQVTRRVTLRSVAGRESGKLTTDERLHGLEGATGVRAGPLHEAMPLARILRQLDQTASPRICADEILGHRRRHTVVVGTMNHHRGWQLGRRAPVDDRRGVGGLHRGLAPEVEQTRLDLILTAASLGMVEAREWIDDR